MIELGKKVHVTDQVYRGVIEGTFIEISSQFSIFFSKLHRIVRSRIIGMYIP